MFTGSISTANTGANIGVSSVAVIMKNPIVAEEEATIEIGKDNPAHEYETVD